MRSEKREQGTRDETEAVLRLIRLALWGSGEAEANLSVCEQLQKQALVPLIAPALPSVRMPEELRAALQKAVYQRISAGMSVRRAEAELPVTVPYVILKGTSAAQYYPNPILRTMGDIDIMTRREDSAAACEDMLRAGWREITDDRESYRGRHREFIRDEIVVEVHSAYARRNDPAEAERLDDLILSHIGPSHVLPDMINGLSLIEHINYHMEGGLGLRQFIDWMMFVHRCLPDERWPEFQAMARQTGHERLAVTATRMCEMYLGLGEHAWCAGADPAVCGQLLRFVMDCGNFGRKIEEGSRSSAIFLTGAGSVKGAFRMLQQRGLMNWRAAQRHRALRPFAWLYQAGRYLMKGVLRKNTFGKLRSEYRSAKERDKLFDALGVTREDRGRFSYRNGEYTLE